MPQGYLSIVLHAHLPYVRHPEYPYFLEEQWLYEAITETYIPLIHICESLYRDKVPFRLTISLSPPLMSMLQDDLLKQRYAQHLEKMLDLAGKELHRTRGNPSLHPVAQHYQDTLRRSYDTFAHRYHKDLIMAFRILQNQGSLEVITCSATHAFLPLQKARSSVRAQIFLGVQHYERAFGRKPYGIWIPECAYFEGLDEIVKEAGVRYFILESHGILHASPRPKYGVFAPIYAPSGVAVFGRDHECSSQVWSATEGYPGDFDYREFYRDIGFELDHDYVKPYISPDGLRVPVGFKYNRITGKTEHKEPYNRSRALDKAAQHAGNFMFNREKQMEYLSQVMDRKPMVVAPYDAELFGHWWYEGPEFLDFFIRKAAYDQKTFELIAPSDYLRMYPINQVSTPSFSSWGRGGFAETWLSEVNDWIYPHLHQASNRLEEMANQYRGQNGSVRRALNQAAREFVLAQSSDWAFILDSGQMPSYAAKRTKEHLLNFMRIDQDLNRGTLDFEWLSAIESRNNIFPELQFEVFCSP